MPTRRTTRRTGPRRKLVWARTRFSNIAIAAGGTQATDLVSAFRSINGGAQPLGSTIARVRADHVLTTAQAAPGGDAGLYCGMTIEPSVTATDVPDPRPSSEPNADWMYWRFHSLYSPWNSQLVQGGLVTAGSWEVDVRSQRKMDELQETLWVVFSNDTAFTINHTFTASVLLMLA